VLKRQVRELEWPLRVPKRQLRTKRAAWIGVNRWWSVFHFEDGLELTFKPLDRQLQSLVNRWFHARAMSRLRRHDVTRELVCVDVDPRLKSWAGDWGVTLGRGNWCVWMWTHDWNRGLIVEMSRRDREFFVPADCGGLWCRVWYK